MNEDRLWIEAQGFETGLSTYEFVQRNGLGKLVAAYLQYETRGTRIEPGSYTISFRGEGITENAAWRVLRGRVEAWERVR